MSKFPGVVFIVLGVIFLGSGVFCLQETDREHRLGSVLQEKTSLPAEQFKIGHMRVEQELAWEARAKTTRTAACVILSLLLFVSGAVVIKHSFPRDKAGWNPPSTPIESKTVTKTELAHGKVNESKPKKSRQKQRQPSPETVPARG